jgi:diguanylate cyclase (GGDEF)-like protein
VILLLAIIWLGTSFTASFAAINERELRRRNYDLQALARLAWRLESALRPHEVGQALVDAIAEDFDIERLVLLSRQQDQLVPLSGRGVQAVPPGLCPTDDQLVLQSVRERRTLRLASPRPHEQPWLTRALPGAVNILALPLFADGAPVGVLLLDNGRSRGARIERRAVEMLERFVSQASLALANARLLAQVRALAAADGLTGVANRRSFDSAVQAEASRSVRSGRPLSLVLFDVDHFKRLNDSYGHQAGDEALKRVAEVLRTTVRNVDLVARYGGEEFVVLMPDTELPAAVQVAERIRAAIAAQATEPRMTASLGVATLPDSAIDPTSLIAAADEALYSAKQQGRNQVVASARRAAPSPAIMSDAEAS